jgi:hypothetical protein
MGLLSSRRKRGVSKSTRNPSLLRNEAGGAFALKPAISRKLGSARCKISSIDDVPSLAASAKLAVARSASCVIMAAAGSAAPINGA